MVGNDGVDVEGSEGALCNTHFGRHRSLALQLGLVPFKGLLSAILQIVTGVVFR